MAYDWLIIGSAPQTGLSHCGPCYPAQQVETRSTWEPCMDGWEEGRKEHIKSLNLFSPQNEDPGYTAAMTRPPHPPPGVKQASSNLPWELQSTSILKAPRREERKKEIKAEWKREEATGRGT